MHPLIDVAQRKDRHDQYASRHLVVSDLGVRANRPDAHDNPRAGCPARG